MNRISVHPPRPCEAVVPAGRFIHHNPDGGQDEAARADRRSRALGLYDKMEDHEKLDMVNRIYSCFLQAMEYHPLASSQTGIGQNHTQHQHNIAINDILSETDRKNAEDMVIIALECLCEVKQYDMTTLNPINF